MSGESFEEAHDRWLEGCQCDHPLIKCDNRGCNCTLCGLPKRRFQPPPCDDCSSFDFSCTGACKPKSFGVRLKVTSIKAPVYLNLDGRSVRRRALPPDHPESLPNWIRANLGIEPEEWMLKEDLPPLSLFRGTSYE